MRIEENINGSRVDQIERKREIEKNRERERERERGLNRASYLSCYSDVVEFVFV